MSQIAQRYSLPALPSLAPLGLESPTRADKALPVASPRPVSSGPEQPAVEFASLSPPVRRGPSRGHSSSSLPTFSQAHRPTLVSHLTSPNVATPTSPRRSPLSPLSPDSFRTLPSGKPSRLSPDAHPSVCSCPDCTRRNYGAGTATLTRQDEERLQRELRTQKGGSFGRVFGIGKK